jgi:hypothetical protein
MRKTLLVFFIFFLGHILVPGKVLAEVPKDNRMQLGEISDSLPASEMRLFYAKMEPLMLKIFGPPFSNINLKIDANLEGTVHNTGYVDNEQTLVLAGQARDYQNNKLKDPKHALEQIYGNMLHELSHGMYYYGNKRVSFNPQWINEGWTKLQEILLAKELKMYNFGIRPYFNYYLDRDTVAGTANWGSSKQTTNHSLVYDITSVTHLTLLSAASTSNDNLDFFKTFNNKVYDWVRANNKTDISLEQYKSIMHELLSGKTIDGESAYDWYFNNPDSFTWGKLGNHLGITTEPQKVIAYTFNRTSDGRDIKEIPLPNIDVNIKVVDYNNQTLLEKSVKTDSEGNAGLNLPSNPDLAIITIEASATISGEPQTASTFYFDSSLKEEMLLGTLIDETGKPVSAKYIGLLKSNLEFDYKDKGVFVITVPKSVRSVTLDFLGFKQEVTKGPFVRMYALTVPAKYIEEAVRQPESTLKEGIVNNQTNPLARIGRIGSQKSPAFVIGIISLFIIGFGAVMIFKYPFRSERRR